MTFNPVLALKVAQSARGVGLLTADEVETLSRYAHSRGELVHTVETYELRGEHEVARIDLGLYGPDENALDKPRGERLELVHTQVADMLADARKEGPQFGFQVWI